MGEKKNIDLIGMTGGFSGLAASSLGMGKGKSTRKSKQNKPKFKGSDDKKVVKSKGKAPDKGAPSKPKAGPKAPPAKAKKP
jgi:hypothetical protein